MRQRLIILSAFVNLAPGAKLFRPNETLPRDVGLRERVTPPGQFETCDEEQVARLIRARCLKATDTAVSRTLAPHQPAEGDGVSPQVSGEAVSHTFPNPDAPSPIPAGEADGASATPATVQHHDTGSHTGPAVAPIPGAGSAIIVGDPNAVSPQESGVSPQAGTGVSPPDAVSPPARIMAPAPAAKPGTPRKGGANPANVAGANSGGGGDGTLSNRERRRLAREQAQKRD